MFLFPYAMLVDSVRGGGDGVNPRLASPLPRHGALADRYPLRLREPSAVTMSTIMSPRRVQEASMRATCPRWRGVALRDAASQVLSSASGNAAAPRPLQRMHAACIAASTPRAAAWRWWPAGGVVSQLQPCCAEYCVPQIRGRKQTASHGGRECPPLFCGVVY